MPKKTTEEIMAEIKKEKGKVETKEISQNPKVLVVESKPEEKVGPIKRVLNYLKAIWGALVAGSMLFSTILTWWITDKNHQHDLDTQKRNHEHDIDMLKARYDEEIKLKNPANVVLEEIKNWPGLEKPIYKLPKFSSTDPKSMLLNYNHIFSQFVNAKGIRDKKNVVKLAITGPPGVGKTSVVKEAAYRLQEEKGMKIIYLALKDTEQAGSLHMLQQHFGIQFIQMPNNGIFNKFWY